MYARQSNKRPVEHFIVSASGEALFNTASAGETLVNWNGSFNAGLSHDIVTLNNKQIGVFGGNPMADSITFNTATALGATATTNPVIYIAQGTEFSSDPGNPLLSKYPLWNRPYEKTANIAANQNIIATKQVYAAPTHSTWIIGKAAGNAQQITTADNTEYSLTIAYRGRRMAELYSAEEGAHFQPSVVTPNFTILGTAEPRDWLIQNFVWQINRNSTVVNMNRTRFRGNDPIIALAFDSTSTTGTDANALVAGNFLPLVNTNVGVRGVTLTAELIASIQAALSAASLPANSSILTVDLTNAGTVTGGVADFFAIVGLDSPLAYEDRIPQVKTRLDVGLTSGFDFNVVYHAEGSKAYEGDGVGRVLDLEYKATQGQRKYMGDHTMDPVIEFPSPVDATAKYVQYTIEHGEVNQIDTSNISESPLKARILIPTGGTAITDFEALMTSWLTSAGSALTVV